jgi:hypothetical protein
MSLLVGLILVYHYDLQWGWYIACGFAYWAEWDMHRRYALVIEHRIAELENALRQREIPDYDE